MQELTPKQKRFVDAYTDQNSETFGNATQSCKKAGYADCKGARVNACRVLAKDYIQAAIKAKNAENEQKTEISRQWLTQSLIDYHQRCKAAGDRTNEARALHLIGQGIDYYGSRETVTTIEDTRLTEEQEEAILRKRLERQNRAKGIGDAIAG